jgi:colanic acid/amylovoran biosynthesis glycosyltransferase
MTIAVITPSLGTVSETFIKKTLTLLTDEKTIIISNSVNEGTVVNLETTLVIDRINKSHRKNYRFLAWRFLKLFGLASAPDYYRWVGINFLRKRKVKAVLGEYLDTCCYWVDVLKDNNLKFFPRAHGYDVSRLLKDEYWVQKYKKLNRADGIIVRLDIHRTRLVNIGLDSRKIFVITQGVDVPSECKQHRTGNTVKCLAVGRMVTKKAPIYTLDAFRRALAFNQDMHLDYIGDGPLLPAAYQYIHALGLENKVTLLGARPNDEVKEKLKDSDIFIQHSITDPFTGDEECIGNTILEGMAYGLPVVATNHAGIPEAVKDGESGFLVEESDTITMAEKIAALSIDPKLRTTMGHMGWEIAKEKFSWERERRALMQLMGNE